MPTESPVWLVSHDPYLDIEVLLSPRINKTAPTFIGTVPCRLIEKDFDLIVVHDYLFHEIVEVTIIMIATTHETNFFTLISFHFSNKRYYKTKSPLDFSSFILKIIFIIAK